MIETDFLRPSRDGDQFHYTWAARQALRLLDESSGLHSFSVEAVDSTEQPPTPSSSTEGSDASTAKEDSRTGDEVIDLAEYWGSSDISLADHVVYRQFKHSTLNADEPWTLSFLNKTLLGFARKYRTLKTNHPAVLDRIRFEFVSNRPAAESAVTALEDLRTGVLSPATKVIRQRLADIISADDVADLCGRLMIDERAPSLLKLRHLLDLEVADLLPGAPAEHALLLREMISSRATSIAGDNPEVRRSDLLASLKTSEDQLLPAPNLLEAPKHPIVRHQFEEITTKIRGVSTVPTLVHGPGGVGKSVLAGAIEGLLPDGSITIVFDCFGNGSYRRPSAPRHQPKQGYVQLVNELAGHALCDPIIPSATADEADYALAFLRRLTKAAETLATIAPAAFLVIIIDAADNAAMIADEMGEQSFVRGLIREPLPHNVRLVVTCRTERIDRLGLPANYQNIQLLGFDLDETRSHLQSAYPNASPADVSEFHARTSHNPRVQATVLDVTTDLQEALAWLAPDPSSAGQALDALIERQVAEIKDRQHKSGADIDAICVGLAALRPMIPVRVLAELTDVHESVVLSFISDLGRPLLVDGNTVQFRDEPTETWFRNRYRPVGDDLDRFIERLAPIADQDAYAAASLPALLFEAGRFDDLVDLALSDNRLPDNALPASKRNEIQRREIAQQRTHFALTAALRSDRDLEAAQLAFRLGALTAGRTRRLDLIRDNTDLAAQFLDASVLDQLIATRSVKADWPNSNLPIEGALLAGAGQTDQARNRLRSAVDWMQAWVRQAHHSDTDSGVGDIDITQIAWGLLNTDGAVACVQFLRSWKPRTLAFDVGVNIARRLLDAGRLTDFTELASVARGRYFKLAIAHACAERDLQLDPTIVAHLLLPVLKRTTAVQPGRHQEYQYCVSQDPTHNGLTAVIWLTSRAVTHNIITSEDAAEVLRRYLPENLGHRTGEWHDRGIWHLILGFTLCARLEGRAIDPMDIEGPIISEARKREKYESSAALRTYRANVEPLISWATAWLDLAFDANAESSGAFAARISEFLQEVPSKWHDERVDQIKINAALILVGRILARFPEIVDQAALLEFQTRHNNIITWATLVNLIRQTATNPATHGLSAELAKRCHGYMTSAREDVGELASGLTQLARATYQISADEALVHFQAALDITDGIGDDAWLRWETLLTISRVAGKGTTDQPGRAYRLSQVAESLEPYLSDYLSHTNVIATAAQLSLPETLSAGSRWRDRRVASIEDLANGLAKTPTALLNEDPLAALAILPLGDQYPDHSAMAAVLTRGSYDAASVIITYLSFRRPDPLTSAALDELLTLSGVSRKSLEEADPSLLQVADAVVTKIAPSDFASKKEKISFADLDFTTVGGWSEALKRGSKGRSPTDLFHYVVADFGITPAVLRAFQSCPTIDAWDLSRLLESLESRSLSMATQTVLDEVLVQQLGRLSPDFLLSSWRTLDLDGARTLTGRDTDYEHVMSRALAGQQHFTADQAYALASHLAHRLTTEHALDLFDIATAHFEETSPLDAHDGHHPQGMTGSWTSETAIAAVIWTALGDPAGKTRWQAAHSVHLALTLGHTGIVSSLLDLATGRISPKPFLDDRLEFYERHAYQWLLFGISRATVEPTALPTAALCENLLMQTVTGTPHAVTTPLARDSLIRLHNAGIIKLDLVDKKRVEQAGKPIGFMRHTRDTDSEEISSFSEVIASHQRESPLSMEVPSTNSHRAARVPHGLRTSPTSRASTDDIEEEQFHLFADFLRYWCNPLGGAFGVSERSIERLVTEVLVDRWDVASRGRFEDDVRHALKLYPPNNHPYKSDWPDEEDLDFYLAVQALGEVAGFLLENRPVLQQYEEDKETGESGYTRFLEQHMPSRDDGRWLSDRRDPAPKNALLDPHDPSGLGATDSDPHWRYRITSDRFTQELLPSPDQVFVWGSRSVQQYSRKETVSVHSALISPGTAFALLRALQTSPNKHAYRIPDTTDEDYSSTVLGFELTGWVEPYGYAHGRDRQDPYAKSVHYPPARLTGALLPLKMLVPDPDCRLWYDAEQVVIVSTVWDDYASERQTTIGSSGNALVVELSWLATVLDKLDRWLVVEVEIQRHLEERSYGRSFLDNDDDEMRYLPPYTKYFLIDAAGGLHEY